MSSLHLQMTVLDVAATIAGFAANWLLQSTLLIASGLAIAWLLRHRGSAVQSLVYRTTLAAVLLCPLATGLLSLGGVSGWSLEMPVAWTYDQQRAAASDSPKLFSAAVASSQTLDHQPDALAGHADNARVAGSAAVVRDVSEAENKALLRSDVTANSAPPTATVPANTWLFEVRGFGLVAIGIAFLWVAASSILLVRLGSAWRQLAQIRRGATPAGAATQQECREIAGLLAVSAPEVLQSPYLASPCLVGWLRPAVLLPESDSALPLRDVLIHELAHVRRRDCLWNLLRRVAEALFFYQPLLWILTRRLETTAEEVCDDYVVQLGGNREEYARSLVDLAELCLVPVGAAGVAMVSLRSILARRVRRILDTSRSLSTRASHLLLVLVIAAGLVGTLGVGFIGLSAPLLATAADEAAQQETGEKPTPDKVVEGRVIDENGRPVSGVPVAVIARWMQPGRGGDLDASGTVLAEGVTEKDGHYRLSLKEASSKTHANAAVIARKEGTAVAWQQFDLDAATDVLLKLVAEEPIHVKLLDAAGKPAAGVRLTINGILKRTDARFATEGVGYSGDKKLPTAWPAPVTSDDDGRLILRGVPASHGVYLEVAESDRFAPQDIVLNTGAPEERGEHDGTYRGLFKNAKPGEEAILTLAAAQPFEGVVRYEDTGEVAPHARITIWASDQEPFGSMVSVAGKADDKGRYRIVPKPGIRFGVTAYPPDGTPYLARQTAQGGLRWEAGDKVKQVDLKLPRGVLLKGKIVEAGTATPVAGVSVQYIPERHNNSSIRDDILTGWQALQITDKNGDFSIVALPGPGRLLAHSAVGNYVFEETSDRELALGKPGGERTYAHAIVKVEPAAGSDPMDLKMELQPGGTATGQMVDERGEPINEAIIVSRLNVSPFSLDWRGHTEPVLGGRFELTRLAKDVAYPVYFLDAKKQLGATETIKAGDKERNVVLKPCGKAKLRFVNGKGEPVAGNVVNLHMVVTPGAPLYDVEAARKGEPEADADFIGNVDRTNYSDFKKSDKDGNLVLPALIPGATYQIAAVRGNRGLQIVKEFQVKSNETLELGDLVVEKEK